MKTVIILRGVSGSGKSTLANLLTSLNEKKVRVVTADDFFVDEHGNYNFDGTKIKYAHQDCYDKFINALEDSDCDVVVVANTNTSEWEFEKYLDEADNHGAMIISLVIENRHGNTDIHNCPDDAKQRQVRNIINSLKLI